MTTLRKAAQQALEALEKLVVGSEYEDAIEAERAITALKAALAEPVQEPVAIVEQLWSIIDDIDTYTDMAKADDKLYRSLVERRQADRWKTGITTDGYTLNIPSCSAPTPRKPLTEEEIIDAVRDADLDWARGWALDETQGNRFATLARAIERAHGIGGEA